MNFRVFVVLFALSAFAAKPAPKPSPKASPKPKASVPASIPVALPNYDEETSVKLQIFLDNNYFGPGKIDGRIIHSSTKAGLSFAQQVCNENGQRDEWQRN